MYHGKLRGRKKQKRTHSFLENMERCLPKICATGPVNLTNFRIINTIFNSLSETEALNRLLTYTTFLVTRDPLERFVSAHRSKFSNVWDDEYYVKYGKRVAASQAEKYLKGVNFTTNKYVKHPMQTLFIFRMS